MRLIESVPILAPLPPLAEKQPGSEPVAGPDVSVSTPVVPGQSESVAEPVERPEPEDKGIGGHQHNLIRERIEIAARSLGYSISRENPAGKGQKIDLVLQNSQRAIACEIAITTTIDHEVGNVAKCVKGGFKMIAVVSPSADRLEKIKVAVNASLLPEEAACVAYHHPDSFISFLKSLTVQDAQQPNTTDPMEKQYGKYKVKSSVAKLTDAELKAREAAALAVIAETMRKKQ
jgi:hypothetical protein